MVSVAIIAIAFVSVLKLYTQSVGMNIASNFYIKAPLLAQRLISEWETGMMTEGYNMDFTDCTEDFPGFSFEMDHQTVGSDSIYPENQDDGDSILYEIACTILYNNGEYKYSIKSLKFLRQ